MDLEKLRCYLPQSMRCKKMGLNSNSSAMKIMPLVDHGETAEWLVDSGNPQEAANCIWACGKLGINSPNLFQLLDKCAQWFVDHGKSTGSCKRCMGVW